MGRTDTSTSTMAAPTTVTMSPQQLDSATTTTVHHPDHPTRSSSSVSTSSIPPAYDPERVYTPEHLSVMNLLFHPFWVFDYVQRRMRWANNAAVEMWNATSLDDLLKRDFTDISPASAKRLEGLLLICEQGQSITDQWTLYPNGQAKTVHLNVSGLRMSKEEEHTCIIFEGIPLVKEELVNETLRGVEMLRHLPMAVCQFDMEGRVMFQNPQAALWEEKEGEDDDSSIAESGRNHDIQDSSPKDGGLATQQQQQQQPQHQGTHSQQQQQQQQQIQQQNSNQPGLRKRRSLARKRKAETMLHRFMDVEVGRRVLKEIQTQEQVDLEAMLHTQKGPRWSAVQLRRSKDPVTGEPVILYSAQDKSDALKAQEERQAREQKSEFLAIMAHEIRTPLHQVVCFIDLLDHTALDCEQKSFVKLLKASAQGLMTVINDVLDYSKLEAGKMKLESIPYEPLMVTEGSLEAIRASCEEKNLSLNLEWCKDIPFRLKGDPNRLRQVLLNLLSNAVKFTHEGGITIQADLVQEVNNDENNTPMVKFVVKDTGIGVSKEYKDVIFEKYQQANISVARQFGGTGLGLSICQYLVHNMGGKIGVDSEPGKGASFWFYLPAQVPTETESTESIEDDMVGDIGGLHILVAEDNKVNQKLVVNMLRRMGHTSTVAENGRDAITMIEKGKFDAVLMDIQMPVMDGFEATRRLRTMGYTDLPIYGLTASVSRSDFTELGFNDWLAKPIPMKDLKAKLFRLQKCLSLMREQQRN